MKIDSIDPHLNEAAEASNDIGIRLIVPKIWRNT